MRKNRILTLALLAGAWMAGSSSLAWDEPTQVDGVYQIGTASELEWFAEYVNGTTSDMTTEEKETRLLSKAVLTADIDMSGIDHQPIGATEALKYNGVFDGQHHVISNLVINRPSDSQLGLFGWVRGGTTLKNIIMDETCSITGYNRVGSIVGCVQTNVSGDPLEIINCVSFATLTSTKAAGMIGAGASQYPYFEMENCVNAGTITANDKASAFCGWNASAGGNAKMYGCYNIGEIGGTLDGGNIFFRGSNREVKHCIDLGKTLSANAQSDKITWATADPVHSGELCFKLNSFTDLEYNANVEIYTQDLDDPNSIPMPNKNGKKVYQVADLDCAGNPKGGVTYSNTDGGSRDEHNFVDGFCTVCGDIDETWKTEEADGYYHFSTVREIEWWSKMVNEKFHGCMNVKLDADIDFEGVPNAHTPIGCSGHKWAGLFDGQGHHIKGMVITPDFVQYNNFDGLGFFGSVRGGVADSKWGKETHTVEIKNLFIDADCSINHTSNFAAGVVGHVNSTFADAVITIENCGNAANIYTTGKNAAGILGCVEATNVGLKLHNLWNTGNITGKGGESAAICAWTGQRNVNGEVDVEGCWNIGEVDGVDGNGYNMIRRNSNIVPRNIVDLCTTNKGNQGKVAVWNTADPIASGELCYLLNGDQTNIVYTQNIDEDDMPVYGTTSAQVYQAGKVNCIGASVGTLDYNNVSGETINIGHNISDEIGMCDVCHTQFQAPALVDGYYELKNAGHVEWFSNKVAGGDLTINGKLMNDIDFLNVENLHSPIGPNTGSKYNGTFDGQGHRIKNMIIDTPAKDNVGFFGFLRGNNANTTVKNLIIDKSCSISARNRVAAISGSSQNAETLITIENVVNEANVTASGQDVAAIVGGVEGNNPKWYIHNVVNTGTITSTHKDPYAGALFCYQNNGATVVENFLNLGTVNGHRGGNMGRVWGTLTNIIDLSDTDPAGSVDANENGNIGFNSGLEKDAIASGELAYKMGFKQFIGEDEYPSPLNEAEVNYVGEAGYATFCSSEAVELNGDVKAYIITGMEANGATLTLEELDAVASETGVLLEGTYYNMTKTEAPVITPNGNLLVGCCDGGADAPIGSYVLQNQDDVVGFYKVEDGGFNVPEGKAYLSGGSFNGAKALYFGSNETAISNIEASSSKSEGKIYNLAGQRIMKVQKGINIVDGKKVMY